MFDNNEGELKVRMDASGSRVEVWREEGKLTLKIFDLTDEWLIKDNLEKLTILQRFISDDADKGSLHRSVFCQKPILAVINKELGDDSYSKFLAAWPESSSVIHVISLERNRLLRNGVGAVATVKPAAITTQVAVMPAVIHDEKRSSVCAKMLDTVTNGLAGLANAALTKIYSHLYLSSSCINNS